MIQELVFERVQSNFNVAAIEEPPNREAKEFMIH